MSMDEIDRDAQKCSVSRDARHDIWRGVAVLQFRQAYKGDSDEAIIDTEVFAENARKFGSYCASHPTVSIVTAAEKVLGN